MTEPNIVRTRRQRIEARNPGSWSGLLLKCYSKYTNILHCDALRSIWIALQSISDALRSMLYNSIRIQNPVKVIQVHVH